MLVSFSSIERSTGRDFQDDQYGATLEARGVVLLHVVGKERLHEVFYGNVRKGIERYMISRFPGGTTEELTVPGSATFWRETIAACRWFHERTPQEMEAISSRIQEGRIPVEMGRQQQSIRNLAGPGALALGAQLEVAIEHEAAVLSDFGALHEELGRILNDEPPAAA